MGTCMELYIDTFGGLDLDGSTDKNLPYFVVENFATLGLCGGVDAASRYLYCSNLFIHWLHPSLT